MLKAEAALRAPRRDALTRVSYASLGAYAYYVYALGPMLVFLHAELRLSYVLTGAHSSVFAGGTAISGVLFDRLARRFGRRHTFWLSAGGMVLGALMFMLGHTVAATLTAAALLGVSGSLLQVAVFAALADRHGEHTDRALIEANIVASASAMVGPAVLAACASTVPGWRLGLLLPVAAMTVLAVRYRRLTFGDHVRADELGASPLPRSYRPLCLLVAIVTAVEFCFVYYGAELIRVSAGVAAVDAAAAMSFFYLGELSGRIAGRYLTRTSGRTGALLLAALCVTAAGFFAFWLSVFALPATLALFVMGIGVANLYPLALTLALAAAPGRTNEATARAQLGVGMAVFLLPVGLGALADSIGVPLAFGVEPLLIVSAVGLVLGHLHRPPPVLADEAF